MAFARSLISDLALDVLLYQSAYREQITGIVLKESNRIYKLFLERNPEFKGKVHSKGFKSRSLRLLAAFRVQSFILGPRSHPEAWKTITHKA